MAYECGSTKCARQMETDGDKDKDMIDSAVELMELAEGSESKESETQAREQGGSKVERITQRLI